jgi:hypothetical protein
VALQARVGRHSAGILTTHIHTTLETNFDTLQLIMASTENRHASTATVSGQVRATSKVRIPDFPTESELAERVYPLPNGVNGQLLAGESNILPVTEAGHIIRLFLEHSKAFLAREGLLTIKDAAGLDYAGGVHFKEYKGLVGKITLILLDKDDNPIALCEQERVKLHNEYNILGIRPLLTGDEPKIEQDGAAFYPWFRVHAIDNAIQGCYRSISVWNGSDYRYVPMWRVYPSTRRPGAKAANLCMVKKTELLVTQESDHAIIAFLNKKTTDNCTGWEITIAPGIDPALVICTAAIVEDTTSMFA